MKKFFYSLFVILVCSVNIIPQSSGQGFLAKIKHKTITSDEFVERYEMTPGFRRHAKGLDESTQLEFLFTLIAEKLFALQAEELRMDTSEVIKFSAKAFEKMFVRDLLFQSEIKDKISVTDEDFILATVRNATKLYVNFLFSPDKEEIDQIFDYLQNGTPFDTILAESPELEEQLKPIQVSFGQLEERVEEEVFNLKVGEYTRPILTPDGWYIFRVVNREENVLLAEKDKDEIRKTVFRILESRKLRKRQAEFYSEFFKDESVDIDPVIFESLARKISSIAVFKKDSFNIKENDPIYLDAYDVLGIESNLGDDTLKTPFIKFNQDPISTREFIRSIAFDGFNVTDPKINLVRFQLDLTARRFVEHELFYREGIRRGYQNLPEIRLQVQRWVDNYMFQKLQNEIIDSVVVSDQEVRQYYELLNQPKSFPVVVNIIEVLTSDPETAALVVKELEEGADIRMLADKYSERDLTRGRNGEFGRFPVTSYGDIGRIAASMEIGDTYGPLKVPEGFSIFKLIEKYEEYIEPQKPFEQVREQYRSDLMFDKARTRMIEYTYNLAVKYDIELNLREFDNIEVTSLPSFGIRHLGFGGKITAVPILAPNVEWAYRWIQRQNQQIIP